MVIQPSFVEPETEEKRKAAIDAWKQARKDTPAKQFLAGGATPQSVAISPKALQKEYSRNLWEEFKAATPEQPPDPYPTITIPFDRSEEENAERLKTLRNIVQTVTVPSKRWNLISHIGQTVARSFGDQLVAGSAKGHAMATAETAMMMTQIEEVLRDYGLLYGVSHPAKTVLAATVAPPYRNKARDVDKPLNEYLMYEVGASVSEWLKEHLPGDKRYKDSFWLTQVPEGFGSMAAFMAGTAALSGMEFPVWVSAAGLGAGLGATSGYDEAIFYGADEKTARTAARWDGILGLSNGFPIARIFSRLDRPTGGTFWKALSKALRHGGYGTIEEGIQEGTEEVGRNAVARMFDENRKLFDGVLEAGGVGGITGFAMNLIVSLLPGRGQRGRPLEQPRHPQPAGEGTSLADAMVGKPVPEMLPEDHAALLKTLGIPEADLSTRGLSAEALLNREAVTKLVEAAPTAAQKIANLTDPTRKALGEIVPGTERWSKPDRMKFRDMVAATLPTGAATTAVPVDLTTPAGPIVPPKATEAVKPPRAAYGAKAMAEAAAPGMAPETAEQELGDLVDSLFARDAAESLLERPYADTTPVQGVGELRESILRPVEMPELIHFTRELLGRVPRVVKRLGALAVFTRRKIQGVPVAEILVRAQEAGDANTVASIIEHELGHLIDYMPHGTLGRGNVLGRIISSHRRHVSAYAQEAPHAAAGRMSEKLVREELEKLTTWWSGPIEGTPEQQAYRRKPRELYAEAVSVLLSAPAELEQRAPRFYKGFMGWLESKPAVRQELMKLYDMLLGTPEEMAERRSKWVREMFKRGEDAVVALRNSARAKSGSPFETLRQWLELLIWQKGGPAMRTVHGGVGKPGAMTEEEYKVWHNEFYNILTKSENPVRVAMSDIQSHVEEPLLAAGLTHDDLGEYLYHCNVVGMRGEIGSPLGFSPEPSAAQIEHMRKTLGREKFEVLQRLAKRYHDIFFERGSKVAVESGMVSREMFEEVFVPNRDVYATFAIMKYLEGENLPPEIYARYGTFEDSGNQYIFTTLKLASLIRNSQHNKLTRDLVRALEQNEPELVKSEFFEEGWPEKRRRPDPGFEWVTYKDDGKLKRAMVPEDLALAVNRRDTIRVEKAVNFLNHHIYKVFHPLYTFLRASFLAGNPIRDLARTHRSLTAQRSKMVAEEERMARAQKREPKTIPPIYMHDIVMEAASTIPDVRRHLSGKWVDEIQRLIELGALGETMVSQIPILAGQSEVGPETRPIRSRRDPSDKMLESQRQAIRGLGHTYKFAQDVMAVEEYATKMAGHRMLRRMGYSEEEAAYETATKVGTPDYTAGGEARAFINFHPMYGNVMVQGLVQDMSQAFNRDTAPGWWSSMIRWTVIPAIVRYGMIAGLFGETVKEIMKLVPQYYLAQHVVIPIGRVFTGEEDGEGKAVISTFAQDPIAQWAGNATYKICELLGEQMGIGPDGERDPKRVRRYAGDLLGLVVDPLMVEPNPVLSMAGRWGQFASKKMQPWDSFRDIPIVPKRVQGAGKVAGLPYMLKWTIDQFGALSPILEIPAAPLLREPMEGDESTFYRVIRGGLQATGLGRFLRITDGGLDERLWAAKEDEDAEGKRWKEAHVPNEARMRTTRQYLLNNLDGAKLTNQKRMEKLTLNSWRKDVYNPTIEEIKTLEAENKWDEAEVARDRLIAKPEPRPELLARVFGEPFSRTAKQDEVVERQRDIEAVRWYVHEKGIDLVKLRAIYKAFLYERYPGSKKSTMKARRDRLTCYDQVVGGGNPTRHRK